MTRRTVRVTKLQVGQLVKVRVSTDKGDLTVLCTVTRLTGTDVTVSRGAFRWRFYLEDGSCPDGDVTLEHPTPDDIQLYQQLNP